MSDKLLKVIERWRSNESLTLLSEAKVKQVVILPILHELGWNWEDPDEVSPEYFVEDGFVDYALLTCATAEVFIEAKRGNEPLSRHQEQLLDYVRHNVKIAILTNGAVWWFYLPFYKGRLESRKFDTVEFDKQDKGEITQKLIDFLGKENVNSGNAVQRAENLCEKHQILAIPLTKTRLPDEPPYFYEIVNRFDLQVKQTTPRRLAVKEKDDRRMHYNVFTLELNSEDEWILILNYGHDSRFNIKKDFEGTEPYGGIFRKAPSLPASHENAKAYLLKLLRGWQYEKIK